MPNEVHVVPARSQRAFCGWVEEPSKPFLRWAEELVRASDEGHLYDAYVSIHTRDGNTICPPCDAVAQRLIAIHDENAEHIVHVHLRGSATTKPRSHSLRKSFDLTHYRRLSRIWQSLCDVGVAPQVLHDIQGRFRSGDIQNINGAALELSAYGHLCESDCLNVDFQPNKEGYSKPDMQIKWRPDSVIETTETRVLYLECTYINRSPTHFDNPFMSEIYSYVWGLDIPGWTAIVKPKGEVFNSVPRKHVQDAIRARLADLKPSDYKTPETLAPAYQGVPAMTLRLIDGSGHSADVHISFIPAPERKTLGGWGLGGTARVRNPIEPIQDTIKRKVHQHPDLTPLVVTVYHPEAEPDEIERALYGSITGIGIDPHNLTRMIFDWPESDGLWKIEDGDAHRRAGTFPKPLAVLWCDYPFAESPSPPVLYVPPTADVAFLGPLLDAFPVRYLASEVRTL